MTDEAHVNFDAPASHHGFRSATNAAPIAPAPYLIVAAPLGECIREYMARPASSRHLYDIETAAQPPLVGAVLSGEIVAELARLKDFL